MDGRNRRLLALAAIVILAGVTRPAEAARRRAPSRSMDVVATAYCLRGTTASGNEVHRGTVAADPRVLPLGSRIRIRGRHIRGIYIVEDQGAAVKGRRIDIYMPRCDQAKRFGRQRVTVTIERLGVPVSTTR
jgi:3D (Asp-Asp-Asp) domain-containing protein